MLWFDTVVTISAVVLFCFFYFNLVLKRGPFYKELR